MNVKLETFNIKHEVELEGNVKQEPNVDEVEVEVKQERELDIALISTQYPVECVKQEIEYNEGEERAWEESHNHVDSVKNEFDIKYPESSIKKELVQQHDTDTDTNTDSDTHPHHVDDITIKYEIDSLSCRDAQSHINDNRQNPILQNLLTKSRQHKCPLCTRTFNKKSRLIYHQRVHTGEKPYFCEHCARSFTFKSNLNVHQRTHTGEKPYSCEICTRSFAKVSGLKAHQRIHSGITPYSCELCTRSFGQKQCLTRHQRIHTGVKPYSCEICPRSFISKSKLTRHRKIHTGEKPNGHNP